MVTDCFPGYFSTASHIRSPHKIIPFFLIDQMPYHRNPWVTTYQLSVYQTFCPYIRKVPFLLLGELPSVCCVASAKQRVTILNKPLTNIIIALLRTFMGIEDVVTKQLLQFVVALDFWKTASVKLLGTAAHRQHLLLSLSISPSAASNSSLPRDTELSLCGSKEKFDLHDITFFNLLLLLLFVFDVSLISSCRWIGFGPRPGLSYWYLGFNGSLPWYLISHIKDRGQKCLTFCFSGNNYNNSGNRRVNSRQIWD